MDKMYEQFKNPDAIYRPAPFWIWNEEMSSEETIRQLKEMREHGFGGGFAHVRLGLISPYLGEEFFKCWDETLEFCKQNDIKLYMYDENGWPSGTAGGKVMREVPETWLNWVRYRIVNSNEIESIGNRLKVFAYDEKTNTVGKELTAIPAAKIHDLYNGKCMVLYRKYAEGGSWMGGFPMVDLSNPKVTETFIKITHEQYYKHSSDDFGTTIPAVFSDESSIAGLSEDMFLYSDYVSKKFLEKYGYRLEDNFPAIYEDFNGNFDKDPVKVRYDYNNLLSELWITSFIKPISDWCEAHGIAYTGHDQEHSWPQTKGGAYSEQRTYEYRQWPAIDWLLCDALREDATWNDTLLMHEVRSSANQFNKKRTLVEAYGAAGWHSTFRDYKRIGDWLLVNGLNFFAHHLTHYSIIGSRKRDCPQSFDWREPWWDEYTEYNNYLSRASYLLSNGKMESRILYLNPSTTSYLLPISKQQGIINHSKGNDAIKNPDMSDFLAVMKKLEKEQWDFDLGDEFSVANNISFEGNKIKVGAMTYDVVLISDNMKNFRRETVDILSRFAKNGGVIISTGDAADYIEGEKAPNELAELRKDWIIVNDADAVNAKLEELLPKRIISSNGWVTGISQMRRVYDDGREVYFFTNHSMKPFETEITVKGRSAALWNLYTGEKTGIECKQNGEFITFKLSLEWTQSAMIVVNDVADIKESVPQATEEVKLNTVNIIPEKDNNIILDHCSLKVDGKETPEVYYIEAVTDLFKARGFHGVPWLDGIQSGSEFIDQKFEQGSGFEACYKVLVKDGALPTHVAAVIERPDLMNLRVNGVNVAWTGEGHYLDYKMGRIDITPYVKEGMNELVVWSDCFNVRDELEVLILEGDFGVVIENERFVIDTKPENLTYGSWLEQKWRFYPNAVNYNYTCTLDKKPESAKIYLGKYEASAVSVTVNGKYAGVVGRDGDEYAQIADYLKAGNNTITLRVCGSFRNLFGPYIDYHDQTVATWGDFANYRKGTVTPASEYSMIDYGLFEEPKLYVNK